ncbi:MAG: hypothetical protein Q8M98_11720 [Candidatus Cloacimonadaceae bacterium]|nr:hypothetical protein [Candidatus Cloacimonadaceae bacterium]
MKPSGKSVILRHDVDRAPLNSMRFAQIEHDKAIQSTYFFRIVRQSYNPQIIKQIIMLGHEVGYHYEDLDLCNGDFEKAYDSFRVNLDKLRKLYPVVTICMHGSPLSKYDNRSLWQKYDYKSLGIIGEPYFDIDYSKLFYITDTGRKWNYREVSFRDKVDSSFKLDINSTKHLISLIQNGELPDQLMINTHPQRWNDGWAKWLRELVMQRVKNQVKKTLTRK